MKSIQSKVLIIIFSSMLSISILIGFISVKLLHDKQSESNQENMTNICQIKKEELNNVLTSIEQSVNIISNTSLEKITDIGLFDDDILYNKYINEIEELFKNVSVNTQGAVAFYYRINPELKDCVSGFFWSGSDRNFKKEPNTDLSIYDENDIEHVGWFYLPKNNGEPLWISPYKNLNIDIYMISYVVPIYFDDTFIGVVGMDVDFNILTEKLNLDIIYETGFFTLTVDDKVVYYENNNNESNNIKINDYIQTEIILQNGMKLVLSVNEDEIVKEEIRLVITITLTTILLLFIFMLIAFCFTYNVIQPLKELTTATKKVLNGDYDINIDTYSNDEVGVLANTFNTTIKIIHEKMDYINALAFKDSLTSVMSDTSYLLEIERISKTLNKDTLLHLIVFDVNNLKMINDRYGHEFGNKLLIITSSAIATVFNYMSTYRIGGDEFVVIIENETDEKVDNLIKAYDALVKDCYIDCPSKRHYIDVAYGHTKYDPSIDTCYEDVFNRADSIMYQMKKELKENNNK
jgi:diguanylate cyclase (GGDEF)-like protein